MKKKMSLNESISYIIYIYINITLHAHTLNVNVYQCDDDVFVIYVPSIHQRLCKLLQFFDWRNFFPRDVVSKKTPGGGGGKGTREISKVTMPLSQMMFYLE